MGDLASPAVDLSESFHPQDAIARSLRAAGITGGAGLLISAVQNVVTRDNIGAWGVFSRYGGTIAIFAAMGGAYAFTSTATANLREKKDPFNEAFGGALAGAIIGLRKRTMPSVIGNGVALAVTMGAIHYTGGTFFRDNDTPHDEPYANTKEAMRKRFRRPINETINELGEGRGIYGPGYDERRKQRIKQNYGIDVQEPYWKQ